MALGHIVTPFDGAVQDGEDYPADLPIIMARMCQAAYRKGYQAATEAAQARTAALVKAVTLALEEAPWNPLTDDIRDTLRAALEAVRKGERDEPQPQAL